jgi:hypothetical protein
VRRVRQIAKSDYWLRHALSVRLSVQVRLPPTIMRQCFRLSYVRCRFRISTGIPITLPGIFLGFSQSLQANARCTKLGHDSFLPLLSNSLFSVIESSEGGGSSIPTSWTIRGSNPSGVEIRTRLNLPWGPPSLLYNGYSGRGVALTPTPI